MIDDLDGMPGTDITTVRFTLDDVSYEIDLRASNAARLRDALAPFVAAGSRRKDWKAIRAWARANGMTPCVRGTLPLGIVSAFEQAHIPGTPPWAEDTA
jgi:hypothetical protein